MAHDGKREVEETKPGRRMPVWLIVVIVIAVLAVIGTIGRALDGDFSEETEEQVAEEPEEATIPTPQGWRVAGDSRVTDLVESVRVDESGATVMFHDEGDTRNFTGRITSAEVGDVTYPVGDPAVSYESLSGDGEALTDLPQWSVGIWGDEPYDGGLRVSVEGLSRDQYSGLTLYMDLEKTNPSAWDGENETLTWPGQRLTILWGDLK